MGAVPKGEEEEGGRKVRRGVVTPKGVRALATGRFQRVRNPRAAAVGTLIASQEEAVSAQRGSDGVWNQ